MASPAAPLDDPSWAPPAPIDDRPVLLLDGPALEPMRDGYFDFGALVFGRHGASTQELRQDPGYRDLSSGVELFDAEAEDLPGSWVDHPHTRFELVTIANRMDRREQRPGTCGETRLIYRLAYRNSHESESPEPTRWLPMTITAIFEQADDGQGCREVASAWMVSADVDNPQRLLPRSSGAVDRPLNPTRISRNTLLGVETSIRVRDPVTGDERDEVRALAYERSAQPFAPAPEPG